MLSVVTLRRPGRSRRCLIIDSSVEARYGKLSCYDILAFAHYQIACALVV